MTKATTAEGDDIRRSLNWVTARRGILKVYDDHLELGSWHLPYSDFDEAILFSVRQTLIPWLCSQSQNPGHDLSVWS